MLSLFARGALRGRAYTLPRSLPTPARAFTASARTPEPADAPATRAKKAAGGAEGGKTTRGRPKSSTPATTKAATPKAKAKPGPKPKAKPGPKPKKAAPAPKARTRKPASKPPVVRLTAADKPPKLPPTGFILFAKAHRAGQPITSLADARVLIKAAAGAWAALTPHEKQAFRDESAALRPGYDAQRAEWERTIDPAKFALMNKKRRAAGKVRIVRKNTGPPRPLSSFARFFQEFFKNDPSDALDGQKTIIAARARRASKAWHAMSDAEKKVYADAYNRDLAVYEKEKQARAAEDAPAVASA